MMRLLFLGLVSAIFIFVLLPLLVVVVVSFGSGMTINLDPSTFTLKWYGVAVRSDLFRNALVNSTLIGAAAAALSTGLGLAAGFAIARAHFLGRSSLEALLLSPLAVPGIVIGIALLMVFSTVGLRDAWWRLLLGHVLLTFPYCVRTVIASLSRLDRSYEDAAATLGASRFAVFWRVTLPMIRPGVMAGALFAFVISFDNVPVSIFLADAKTTTVPLAIMTYLEWNYDPSVAAASSIVIISMLTFAMVLERLAGLKKVVGG